MLGFGGRHLNRKPDMNHGGHGGENRKSGDRRPGYCECRRRAVPECFFPPGPVFRPSSVSSLPSVVQSAFLHFSFERTDRPAKLVLPPRASSMRSASFHLAMRSERAKEPTLSCPASQPAARCTMVTSSVSPERAETMVPQPARLPASRAAFVSVTVPAWLGLISTALQAPDAAASFTRAALVTRKSSPMICTFFPAAAVNFFMPSASSSARGSSIDTIG